MNDVNLHEIVYFFKVFFFFLLDWVTESLLQRIQSNPNLTGRLSDPQFIQALTEFQQNPQAAIAKYQDDQQLQGAMQQFCNILGKE